MKALLRHTNDHGDRYDCLMFVCPGCALMDDNSGLHMLPVNTNKHLPSWQWDGDLLLPTVSPSIRTRGGPAGEKVCHSFLRAGIFEFLDDCDHPLAGRNVPMRDLPEWVTRERG